MISKKDLKRFINDDFENAILSGRIIDDNLVLRLYLKEKSKNLYAINSFYNDYFDKILKNSYECANMFLDKFLMDNSVVSVNYIANIPQHHNKQCIRINCECRSLVLAFEGNIGAVFPNIVKKIEANKRECAYNKFNEIVDILEINSGYQNHITGIEKKDKHLTYKLLKYRNKQHDLVAFSKDLELIKKIVKDFALENNFYEYTLNFYDYFSSLKRNTNKIYSEIPINEDKLIRTNDLEIYDLIIEELNKIYGFMEECPKQLEMTLGGKII